MDTPVTLIVKRTDFCSWYLDILCGKERDSVVATRQQLQGPDCSDRYVIWNDTLLRATVTEARELMYLPAADLDLPYDPVEYGLHRYSNVGASKTTLEYEDTI